MTRDEHPSWDFGDLDGYIQMGEPNRAERAGNWQTAIGLQAVDGLKTSRYLLETAMDHIEGRIDIAEVQKRINSYYEERADRADIEAYGEADIVSSRIAGLLGERAFSFSPVQLQTIHRRLFDQVLTNAGTYRAYNITQKEWVLRGDTVYYASWDSIADTLRYDFEQERRFSYHGITKTKLVRHLSEFTSGIWQIHPFSEGNTRTTAVFIILYLRSLGYETNNEPFKANSWYFRNALVRANYEDVAQGVVPTTVFLEQFFENLLFGAHHDLRNRYLHLDWAEERDERPRTDQVTDQVKRLLEALGDEELSALQIMERLGLSHWHTFRRNYLAPALAAGLIERTVPDKPTSRMQKYRRKR